MRFGRRRPVVRRLTAVPDQKRRFSIRREEPQLVHSVRIGLPITGVVHGSWEQVVPGGVHGRAMPDSSSQSGPANVEMDHPLELSDPLFGGAQGDARLPSYASMNDRQNLRI